MLRLLPAASFLINLTVWSGALLAADLDAPTGAPPPVVVPPAVVFAAPVYAIPTCGFFTACSPFDPPYALAVGGVSAVPVVPVQPNPMDFHDERNDYNQ